MSNKLITFFSSEKQMENFQKYEKTFSSSFGPLGRFVIFSNKNKECAFLNKSCQINEALDFEKKDEKIIGKFFSYLIKKNHLNSGDNSIMATLFFSYLFQNSLIFLQAGYNGILLSKGMQKVSLFCSNLIFKVAKPIQNEDKIKGIIKSYIGRKMPLTLATFLENSLIKLKQDALCIVEENLNLSNEMEEIQGIEINKGFASSYFINDIKNSEVHYENSLILISKTMLVNLSQINLILDFSQAQKLPLIIIAEGISKELLSQLVFKKIQNEIKVVVINYSSIKFLKTGILEDLATLTHTSIDEIENCQKFFNIKDLGFVEKVIIKSNKSSFFISKFSHFLIERKINQLSKKLLYSDSNVEKELYKGQILRLKSNTLKLKIASNNFQGEKKHINDLIFALKAALEEGYVVGGGSFYLYLFEQIKIWSIFNLVGDELYASQIVLNSLKKLFFALHSQSKFSIFIIFNELMKKGYPYCYDIVENNYFDGFNYKIIDSSKSIRFAFLNVFSILSTLITCNVR